ncbi:MAG: hypothetical protein IJO63_04905 [Bacilli bacterium]|nr:hypothetical protein [Bacilli bacterium]
MGNIVQKIRNIVSNKNTVTILAVIAGIIVIWGFYKYRVEHAVTPIRVPYAKVAIAAGEKITEENIGYTEINSKFLKTADVYRGSGDLIGKYVNLGTSISAGSLFYKKQVVSKAELPVNYYDNIKDGYTVFGLSVSNHSTYGNSIYPKDKIDLYIKAVDENNRIMFGKFVTGIEVLQVVDATGKNVFGGSKSGVPAELMFEVKDEDYELLMLATYIPGLSIVPVPRNKKYNPPEIKTYEFLKNYILAKSAEIPVVE